MPRERLGRIIGIVGAACASAFWGVALFAVAGLLIEPRSATGLAVLVAMPLAIFASLFFVVSVASVIVLARRADIGMPSRVASTHALMAAFPLWEGAWLAASILLAIASTQVVAMWMFRR